MQARTTLSLVMVGIAVLLGMFAMGWFWKSKKATTWDLESAGHPWEPGAAPIYEHIRAHIFPGALGLSEGGDRLPDEKDDGKLKWVAGGIDGTFVRHGGDGSERHRTEMLHRAIRAVLGAASSENLTTLYDQLLHDRVLGLIDPLLERIATQQTVELTRLEHLAVWLAKNSPDREPVKFAIALLGVVPAADHADLLLTLGRHEEFTLYAAVALSNSLGQNAESHLFELAKHVDGWGRIEIIERLAATNDAKIKAWMLREGYKNSVMYEYLAYTCASVGDLRRELAQPSIDPILLAGAGDIIEALINGGPAQDMDDYADGAFVVERYLHHVGAAPRDLKQLLAMKSILGFLDENNAAWQARETRGWTSTLRASLRAKIRELKALPDWEEAVTAGFKSEDDLTFNTAFLAARALGLDPWDQYFARLKSGKYDGWYHVMQTEDAARIDLVVALAEQVMPLDKISTGPATEMGLGLQWTHHGHLDFVLQDLRRFPGKGWPLIRTGIRSPVIRNRHMALRALSTWGKDKWPAGAEELLVSSLQDDPDQDVRGEIKTLLAGKQIEEPRIDIE